MCVLSRSALRRALVVPLLRSRRHCCRRHWWWRRRRRLPIVDQLHEAIGAGVCVRVVRVDTRDAPAARRAGVPKRRRRFRRRIARLVGHCSRALRIASTLVLHPFKSYETVYKYCIALVSFRSKPSPNCELSPYTTNEFNTAALVPRGRENPQAIEARTPFREGVVSETFGEVIISSINAYD